MEKHLDGHKVLLVDDSRDLLESLGYLLSLQFNVTTATTAQEAMNLILPVSEGGQGRKFDCAVLDITLGGIINGFQLAIWCREAIPQMRIVLISADPTQFFDVKGIICDESVDKVTVSDSIVEIIQHVLEAPGSLQLLRASTMIPFVPFYGLVTKAVMAGSEKTARFDGNLYDDAGGEHDIMWTAYTPRPGKLVICPTCSRGGCGMCAFCSSGRCNFEGQATWPEMVSQIALALKSHIARFIFEDKNAELVINWDKAGDVLWHNLDNCCNVVEFLWSLKKIRPSLFIFTTTGQIGVLRRFMTEYPQFRNIPLRLDWSLPFFGKLRAQFQPVPATQDLQELRQAFVEASAFLDRRVTIAQAIAKGLNDSKEAVESAIKFVKGLHDIFEFKLMPMRDGSLPGVDSTTKEDLDRVRDQLVDAGIDVRIRYSHGEEIGAGCGQNSSVRNMLVL